MYAVFLFPADLQGRVRELLEDDTISRQSVTTRDAQVLGTGLEGLLVVLEGDPGALDRFQELAPSGARRLGEEEAQEAYRLLKEEEEEAASGVGFLFGGG